MRTIARIARGMRRWALRAGAAAALGAFVAVLPQPARRAPAAEACAFATPPLTYETTEDRRAYMTAMELAGYDMLFPRDRFFSQASIEVGTRDNRTSSDVVYVPPVLLKSISWLESVTTMGARSTGFGSIGPALVSFDCGYGIAQVTSGMTAPEGDNGQPTDQQAAVATHFAYNIGRGAAILIDKWNNAPEARPVAGIDTNSDPHIIENWYYAVWGYNGFTGPGANRSNHPLDPIYGAWPRTPYSCGPQGDGLGHNRSQYPYQELVFGCVAHPPSVQGQPLWTAVPVTLPDLNNPYWRTPLDLKNFQYPYAKMDIPTPKPEHTDPTPKPPSSARAAILGQPRLQVSAPLALVTVRPGQSATAAQVRITNPGTGITAWRVTSNKSWVTVTPAAGVAIGDDLPCNNACDRGATVQISADPSKVTGSDAAIVRVQGIGGTREAFQIAVFLRVNVAIGVPGTTRN